MLQKKYRLPKSMHIQSAQDYSTPFFTLKTVQNNLLYNRFGFIVSKRVDKKAVGRNKIKRMYTACIQSINKSLKPGYDMLFIIKKQSAEMKFAQICDTVTATFTKGAFLL